MHLPDRYRDPEQIGRGGMGEIYRATDELLGRVVAVKVLAERYAEDPGVRERFTREALAAARLSGRPNVVTIFDVGEAERPPVHRHGVPRRRLARGPRPRRTDPHRSSASTGSSRPRLRSTPRTRKASSTGT